MPEKFKIDFLGIGAERSATTWIADCLREHPQIFIPKEKELYFFNEYDPHFLKFKNLKYTRGIKWYKNFFKNTNGEVKGEISPTYLYCKLAPKRIKKHFPKVKLIVSLRNPVDRAYSQFLHDKHIGVVGGDMKFDDAIFKYAGYIKKGKYFQGLKRYLALFPKENILVVIYDDLKKNPKKTIQSIYKFLGVSHDFVPKNLRKYSNTAASSRFPFINYFMVHAEYFLKQKRLGGILEILEVLKIRKVAFDIAHYINKKPLTAKNTIPAELKKPLYKNFEKDISQLEKLINRDLTFWKKW